MSFASADRVVFVYWITQSAGGEQQVARWFLTYQNSPAAMMYAGVTILTFVLIVAINFLVPTATRARNTPSEAESAERDAQRMDEGKLGEARVSSNRVSNGGIRRRNKRNEVNPFFVARIPLLQLGPGLACAFCSPFAQSLSRYVFVLV